MLRSALFESMAAWWGLVWSHARPRKVQFSLDMRYFVYVSCWSISVFVGASTLRVATAYRSFNAGVLFWNLVQVFCLNEWAHAILWANLSVGTHQLHVTNCVSFCRVLCSLFLHVLVPMLFEFSNAWTFRPFRQRSRFLFSSLLKQVWI